MTPEQPRNSALPATSAPDIPGARTWSRSREDTLTALQLAGPSTLEQLSELTGLHPNTLRDHLAVLADSGIVEVGTLTRNTRGRPPKVYSARSAGTNAEDQDALPAARAAVTNLILGGYGRTDRDLESDALEDGRRLARSLGLTAPTGPTVAPAGPDVGDTSTPQGAKAADTGGDAQVEAQLRALSGALARIGFRPAPARRVEDSLGAHPRPSRTPASPTVTRLDVDLCHCPFRDLAVRRPEVVCAMHLGLAREVTESVGGPLHPDSLSPFVGPRTCTLHLSR